MEDARGPSREEIARRRAVALVVVIAALVLIWFVFLRGSDEEDAPVVAGPAVSAETTAQVEELSPAELADQVMLVGFAGAEADPDFAGELDEHNYGGVLVRSENWTDAATGTALVGTLRAAGREDGRIPPLIVATQEGGRYRSFSDLPPPATELEIGDDGSTDRAQKWARDTSKALREAGFDLNLFPVADVSTLDAPIADRAFSDDAATVTELTAASIRGCTEAGLACAALHFPGLGGASADTDRGQATVGLDPSTLESRDLTPFATAFAEGMPAVVLSHAFYAAFDPITPGSLSPEVVTGLLRTNMGFEGVAITDDLGAGAIRAGYSVPKAAVESLAAGADLVRIDAPEDQAGVREAIVASVGDGSLPLERLQAAAARVLELKRSRGLTVM
jgi:beta-N-acetylhexosaminidase